VILFSWIALKLFLKKAWTWLKNYWYAPVVFVWTIVVWVFSRRNGEAALEVLASSKKSYEAQIDVLKKTHADEVGKRDKALEQYEDIVRTMEFEYARRSEEISRDKKKKVKEYIKEFDNDPDGLAARLEERFGIRYKPGE
jgi:hypothetical protein